MQIGRFFWLLQRSESPFDKSGDMGGHLIVPHVDFNRPGKESRRNCHWSSIVTLTTILLKPKVPKINGDR